MRYVNKHFTDETVRIDVDEFENCRFTECRIVFTGAGPAKFANCIFDQCQWVFDGPAENTIQYFAALYNGLGPGGKELIEGIFDSIRKGGVGHGALLPSPAPALR